MRIALIVYHKNLHSVYPKEWIDKFKESILSQTLKEFSIVEVDYGGGGNRIFENSVYESIPLANFVHAMNFLFTKCGGARFDCVANANVDDWYSVNRLERQVKYIEAGYDVVSSNFVLVKDDKVVHTHYFDTLDINKELAKDHNIICHPVCMYSQKFIQHNKYDPILIPFEDMLLWKKTMWDYRFVVLEDILCYHRLHDKSVGHKLKEE